MRKLFGLLLVCFIFFSSITSTGTVKAEQGEPPEKILVIGGGEAAATEALYAGRLLLKSKDGQNWNFICGLTLLDPVTVITSGHCVESLIAENFMVQLGVKDTTKLENQVLRKVVQIIMHPGHTIKNTVIYDVALLRLDQPSPYNEHIQPLSLAKHSVDWYPQIDIFGFGITSLEQKISSPILKKASGHFGYFEERLVFGFTFWLKFVFGASCFGDSGSAYVGYENGQPVLLGMNSTSDCETTALSPNLSPLGPTQVANAPEEDFYNWIKSHLLQNKTYFPMFHSS